MARKLDLLFEVVWLGWDEEPVGTFDLLRYDLTEAIQSACRLMQLGHAPQDAHGFFVRRKEEA